MGSCHSRSSAHPTVLGPTYSRHDGKEEVNINFDNLFVETNEPSPLADDHITEEKHTTPKTEETDETVESDSEKDMCSICYNKIEKNSEKMLDCGHKYHECCIDTWLKESKTCPICREPCLSEFESFIVDTLANGSIY